MWNALAKSKGPNGRIKEMALDVYSVELSMFEERCKEIE